MKALPSNWHAMAARLSHAVLTTPNAQQCLLLMKTLNERLGSDAYPGFIKLLIIIAESDEQKTKVKLADAMGLGIKRRDLPCGELNAWGMSQYLGTQLSSGEQNFSVGTLMRSYWSGAAKRGMAPIEYLTVWHNQKTQRPYLTDETFVHAMKLIIDLVNVEDSAAKAYADMILGDLEGRPEGAFTRQTKLNLQNLATAWKSGHSSMQIAKAALG